MHLEALLFNLMTTENTQQAILAQELLDWLFAEVVRAVAFGVLLEVTMKGLFIFHRVSPHQVTEDAIEWDLLLTVDLINLLDLLEPR